MRILARLLLPLLLLFAGPASAQDGGGPDPQHRPLVRIITNGFVLPGKLDKLAAWAEETGVALESIRVETAPGEPAVWLAGADLLILDTPRPSDLAMVQERLGPALDASGVPWIRIGAGPPAFERLAPEHARRLIAYYAGGGETNLRRMLAYLRDWHAGRDTAALPPAELLPKAGFYHPAAPRPFASVEEYLSWGTARWPVGALRIAFAIHASTLANMQTRLTDALVAGSEKRGMAPLVFWFDAADPDALRSLLRPAGADVLVNLHHMQNGPARQAEFLELGIPVLQTTGYREGDPAAWRRAANGVPIPMVAPFLSLPESWGMSDPLAIEALEDGEPVPIAEQVEALLGKVAALAALRHTPNGQKRLALMFWNYPAGEKNLSASNLNVPRSLERLTETLAAAGYDVPPTAEARLIEAGQTMLAALHRPERLDRLLANGLAEAVPLARYRAWLDHLPAEARDAVLARWGAPDQHWALRPVDGETSFVIPRLRLGKLVIMPQPPRGGRPGDSYHDTKQPPDHLYLATYLFLRQSFAAQALIHFGTHGTQEWMPGKDRGLSAHDFPFLAVGDLPVFYPYIQDNIGEAIQAKRRGRAVTVSHQTPAFAPAGLYDELRDLHALIHEHGQLTDGTVRDSTAARIREAAIKSDLHNDLGWEPAAMEADFDGFLSALHDHLHELARHAMPLGLHSFGEPSAPEHRLSTVMQQLGEPLYRRLGLDPTEVFVEDFRALRETPPYRLLHRHLRDGAPLDEVEDPELRDLLARAMELDRHLADTQELESLLTGLEGGFIAPGPGGDPVRNPDVPSGRNLYAFEADKIPTRPAHEAGGEALAALLDAYRAEHDGAMPEKLAFSLWSSEALRHLGVLESQILHALGLRPVWDAGGRVKALDIIPATELGRPRIDVVVQVTSVYRDQFDGFMRLLADAIDRLSRLEEPGNPVARNSARLAAALTERGIPAERARQLASLRLFSNEPGDYGSGLPDRTLASTGWDSEAPLAEQFLSRLQYGYGSQDWGVGSEAGNLFAEQLRGVQAAVLARSSRLHGVLSTDHPFEYLGGLALAVRHLDGASPSLYIADLRDAQPRVTGTARFLADELRARSLNPHWITAMQAEGYAGTLEILRTANNLWGWQVTAPETVRADQWQALHDTFVRDRRELGLNGWFEQHNPTAQAQLIERLVEAVRKGYWDAGEDTRRELAERWNQLARDHGVDRTPETTRAFIAAMATGFGLDAAAPNSPATDAAPSTASPDTTAGEPVRGQIMQPVPPETVEEEPWRLWAGLAALLACLLTGALRQARSNRPAQS